MLQRMAKYWQRNPTTDSPTVTNRLPVASTQPNTIRTPVPAVEPAEAVVLFQRVSASDPVTLDATTIRQPQPARKKRPLSSVSLKRLGILDSATRDHLEAGGVQDAAAFVALPSDGLLPRISVARMKRLQHAVRMAHTIDDMRPWHALLLFAIHRRSPNKLAGESAGTLYRDIKRFAWSSRGQRLLSGRAQPTAEQVQGWIESARGRRQRLAA
jgi:hypothetical protein